MSESINVIAIITMFVLSAAICFALGHAVGYHRGLKAFCKLMERRSPFDADEWYEVWLKSVK